MQNFYKIWSCVVENTCCFFGHRNIRDTAALRLKISETVERLIVQEKIDTFLFGSNSRFDSLCHELVTKMKTKYPHIKRIFVRAEYPFIDESYKAYILQNYEDTYYPAHMVNAGKAAYVERNCEMIDKSHVCVIYCDPAYSPPRRRVSQRALTDYQPNSGTKVAFEYAVKKGKQIINVF